MKAAWCIGRSPWNFAAIWWLVQTAAYFRLPVCSFPVLESLAGTTVSLIPESISAALIQSLGCCARWERLRVKSLHQRLDIHWPPEPSACSSPALSPSSAVFSALSALLTHHCGPTILFLFAAPYSWHANAHSPPWLYPTAPADQCATSQRRSFGHVAARERCWVYRPVRRFLSSAAFESIYKQGNRMGHHGKSSSGRSLPIKEVIFEVSDFLVSRTHSVHSVPLLVTDGSKSRL